MVMTILKKGSVFEQPRDCSPNESGKGAGNMIGEMRGYNGGIEININAGKAKA